MVRQKGLTVRRCAATFRKARCSGRTLRRKLGCNPRDEFLKVDDIGIDTDFARITVMGKKDNQTRDGLLEHALHMLMAEYRERYGKDATQYVLTQLEGHHGR